MSETNPPAVASAESLEGRGVVVAGPGRVGSSLAHWLTARGARLVAVAGRRRKRQATWPEAPWRPLEDLESADADLLLLTVADDALAQVAGDLARRPQAPVVLHVSGHFDAAVLAPLGAAGHAVGAWHPLRAFPSTSRDPSDAAGVTFALDGDPRALAAARGLTAALGGRAIELAGEQRVLYHLAASLAAGGVVTVLAAADELRRRLRLPPEVLSAYLHLARGAVSQVPEDGGSVASAITGPAARGDRVMLGRQRDAVAAVAPDVLPLFDALNQATERLRSEPSEAPA